MELDILELESELKEKSEDLRAFIDAREIIRNRVLDVRDSQYKSSLTPLPEWSGTDAVLGSLDLCIHAIEHTLEELKQLIKATQLNRSFRVVEGGNNGNES
jgi:hypothetical protein